MLLLLNGAPGIGKSTLAALYADRHPGTLDLDIDHLHRLVGGWQDPDQRTHDLLRPVALAMAATHLAGGHDVVVPQFLDRADEVEAFTRVAAQQSAAFVEIALVDDRDATLDRFDLRPADSAWEVHNRRVVASMGGREALGAMHDRLAARIASTPSIRVVPSRHGTTEETYDGVLAALADVRA